MSEDHFLRLLAAMSYLGILIIFPLVVAYNFDFVRFHVKQGFILISVWLLLFSFLFINESLGNAIIPLGTLVLSIFSVTGVYNSIKGKKQKLIFIGDLIDYINR